MRALIQRVTEASVTVEDETVGRIGPGLLIFVCAMRGESEANADKLAGRIARMRIFRDGDGKTNLSLADVGGAALVVSQFTLAADTSRGNRPGFSAAASASEGERLYEHFIGCMRATGIETAHGRFGAEMRVSLVNDGPMTIWTEC